MHPSRGKAVSAIVSLAVILCWAVSALDAQVNVLTYHNDNARTGQNTLESVLTPSNVNASQFGKLYSVPVDGYVFAQPLLLNNVSIPGQGTHNVVYVATENDSLYAIDAVNGFVLWQVNFLNPSAGITTVSNTDVACTDFPPQIGITSTPVIDPTTGTIYLLARTKENGTFVHRLHAIDVATHVEKFGGPVVITATVPGTGDGSSGSSVTFDGLRQGQRTALLLQNGHVILGWASECDIAPYHGWVMSYNAGTLAQEAVWNDTPNGSDGGVWIGGSGCAGDASFNTFFATGNGTYDGSSEFGDSIVKVGQPTAGTFNVGDWFTPFNQATLSAGDTDLGSGGVLLLPDLPAGSPHQHLLVQAGKQGMIYLIDRDNMGHYCSTCTNADSQVVQEIQALSLMIGAPAYWNGNLFFGAGKFKTADYFRAFSFNANNSGLISTTPTSLSPEQFSFPAPTPSISANGNANGIVWALENSSYISSCCQVLHAYDATNLATELYTSNQAPANRDVPGGAVKFSVPTVANGRVYVGSQASLSIYGLLQSKAATPSFGLAPGTYSSQQSVSISDSSPGVAIYYTTDGSAPTTSSTLYAGPMIVTTTTTINAIAAGGGFTASQMAGGTFTITSSISSSGGISFGSGFNGAGMTLNGNATYNGTRLRLTDGGAYEASSAFSSAPVNIQSFTTDFSFQLTNPNADGITFTVQGNAPTALGVSGEGLGYGGMNGSVAVKFDLFNNAGEGINSTGVYFNGADPTVPAIDLNSSGVNLHSGDVFNVHLSYSGTTLTMTITDASNSADTFTTSWRANIPSTLGKNTAYVGFTGGTGGVTATQDILTWTFSPGINFGGGFTGTGMTLNGNASYNGTRLRLTDGGTYEASSAFYTAPVNIQSFVTAFSFQLTNPDADGITFTVQGNAPTAIGALGGALGSGGMDGSVAVKFDLFNNAGEGINSVGVYFNGAYPAVPAIDLTSSGVNLHSGDVFNVQLRYSGTTLTMTITDASNTADTFTTSWGANIPSTLGKNTAYVGFTGGSGGLTATQEVLTWTF